MATRPRPPLPSPLSPCFVTLQATLALSLLFAMFAPTGGLELHKHNPVRSESEERVRELMATVDESKTSEETPDSYHPYVSAKVPYRHMPFASVVKDTIKIVVVGTAEPIDPTGQDAGLKMELLNEEHEHVSALWVTDQDGRVIHLIEFDPKTGFSEDRGDESHWPAADLPISSGLTSVTAYAFCSSSGIWQGNTIHVTRKTEL